MTIRLDIGCGKNKRQVLPGESDQTPWVGVDSIDFPGVDVVLNVCQRTAPRHSPTPYADGGWEYQSWPWETSSVDEISCSHFLEHLDQPERCFFFNELWRVMKPGAKGLIITPHWASNRAYGDPTHKWPALSEMAWYYLSRDWRLGNEEKKIPANAPHTDKLYLPWGYDCDFEVTWGYSFHPALTVKHDDVKREAMSWWKEACQDMMATLTCLKPAQSPASS